MDHKDEMPIKGMFTFTEAITHHNEHGVWSSHELPFNGKFKFQISNFPPKFKFPA